MFILLKIYKLKGGNKMKKTTKSTNTVIKTESNPKVKLTVKW